MPSAATSADQNLTNNTLANDPQLFIALGGGYLYNIFAYLLWEQPLTTNGGFKAGLATDAAVPLTWNSPLSGSQALPGGSSVSFTGINGPRSLILFGTGRFQVPETVLRVKRAQANNDAAPTILRANSTLVATLIPDDQSQPALAALPTFVAPINPQNYNVPIQSPIGSTVLLSTASQGVLAARPTRRGVAFINSSDAGVNIYVCPANQTAVPGQGLVILPGAMVPLLGNEHTLINVTTGWNACAASGSGNPLSILEFV